MMNQIENICSTLHLHSDKMSLIKVKCLVYYDMVDLQWFSIQWEIVSVRAIRSKMLRVTFAHHIQCICLVEELFVKLEVIEKR